ncbi:uncharacterized protein LTR77_002462 [Saxophila tyrrhenica]|uniref:rRNA-processing protein EFG1 n=1 Tax=Saxophila tyrrhenica TaxID=1690608 RepID=A0AAV9PKJ6_9PEZI|nr:hypothetical protein LTR77_002462 [Saxophila tyrrhenica]
MATKRPAPQVHSSRQAQVPGEPKRKRQKPDNAGPKSFKKAHPVNELKSQIRSLKRLLERDEKLPGTVRMEKERQLQTAERELVDTQRAKQKSDMISRYHKIRFFDRQKATKRLKRVRKELRAHEADDEARAQLVRRVDDGEVDVNYAQYFPLDQHYVSLFPRKGVDQEDGAEDDEGGEKDGVDGRKGDEEMWQLVKQCMTHGRLDDLRHGRLSQGDPESLTGNDMEKQRKAGAKANSKPSEFQRGRDEEGRGDSEDETGGGFFE